MTTDATAPTDAGTTAERDGVASTTREIPKFDVPDGAPVTECPYCQRPFASERLWALHLGERHPESCTEAERDAVEAATDEELDELFVFHIKIVATLTLLYAALVLIYMVVLGWG